jgi:hypothetical protein
MVKAGRKSLIKVTSSPVAMLDEPTTEIIEGLEYQITDAAKRILSPFASITVEVDADGTGIANTPTIQDSSTYTLNRLTGRVVFNSTLALDATVTISGDYLPVSTAAESHEYSYTIEANNENDTSFGDDYVSRVQTLLDFNASLSKYHIDQSFVDRLISGDPFVLEIYADSGAAPMKAWCIMTSDEVSSSVDGLVEESVEVEGTQDAERRVISRE